MEYTQHFSFFIVANNCRKFYNICVVLLVGST